MLPAREQDIHLIVGPNEAGKSTVRTAISDWLFGIPMRTPLAFLHPMPELRLGGIVERFGGSASAAQSLAFERAKGNKNTLRTPQDQAMPESALQPWLGSLQAQAFARMYALDHAALVEGGAGILSASDDLGRMLFQSAAGLEHLGEELRKLQDEADALWAPRRSAARVYYQAFDSYESASAEFKRATLRARDWKSQHEALLATEQALEGARARHAEIRLQLGRLERIRRVRPVLQSLDAARSQFDELLASGTPPLLDEGAGSVLREARQSVVLLEAEFQRLSNELNLARARLEEIQVDEVVLSLATDITDLNEQRLQFRAHRIDIAKRQEEIRVQWHQVQELAAGLGWSAAQEDDVRLRLPAQPVRGRLTRVLKERAGLAQELRSATESLAERQRQIQQAEEALGALGATDTDPALENAVEQALRLGDHDAAVTETRARLDGLGESLVAALTALGNWRCEPTQLGAMVVPELSAIRALIDENRHDQAEAQSLQSALDDKAHDIDRHELELLQLVRDFQPVSTEQVQEARRVRDAEWQSIRRAPEQLPDRAGPFESYLGEADRLADGRLERAKHEADRQAKAERIEQQRQELRTLEERVAAARSRIDARDNQWTELGSACGLPGLPLEAAPLWMEQRQRVLELAAERSVVERQLRNLRDAGAAARMALWTALRDERTDDAMPELPVCLLTARRKLATAEQALGQRSTLQTQLREHRKELAALQDAVQRAQDAWTKWESTWRAAMEAARYEPTALPDQVEAELDVMKDVELLLGKIRSIRSERIETMQADLAGMASAAAALAERAAVDLGGRPAEDIALELGRRLDVARKAESAAADLRSRIAGWTAERLAVEKQQRELQAMLAPFFMAAGVEEIGALATAIDRSDRRRAIETKIDDVLTELGQAADGHTVQQLRAEMSAIGPDDLKAELERLGEQSATVVDEIAKLSNSHGTQKAALEAFVGGDAAARAEAQRQEAIAAMAEAAERYLTLHTASRLLKWSIEKFRETKQGPMLSKASSIFCELTLNSFARLLVDSDGQTPRLFGVRPNGEQVDVAGMSEGSRDQLYLALRLAALELQVEQGMSMPLIADDLFINFDDLRTAAGLRVLAELSRRMQVVFLTHHDHMVPLAREVIGPDLNVVEL